MTVGLCWLVVQLGVAADVDLATVRTHLARGRYAEAVETLEGAPKSQRDGAEATLLLARSQHFSGESATALTTLTEGALRHPQNADLLAEHARVLVSLGQLTAADAVTAAALKINPDHPLARLMQAEIWTATGDLQRASEGYRWFVRYYNRIQPTDAETLMLIGRGAAQYARWKSVSQIFDFIVNTVCVDALKADPECWEAHWLAGELLLEKYNRADGMPELQKALAINPHAAEAQVVLAEAAIDDQQYDAAMALAERILSINTRHAAALRVKSKVLVLQGRLDDAAEQLQAAQAACPTDQRTAAAAAFLETLRGQEIAVDRLKQLLGNLEAIDSWDPGDSKFEAVVVGLAKVNPHPGYFLQELGKFFEGQRKFRYAEACYAQAIAAMPQLSQPKTDLGMLYFQAGRMEEAERLLNEAFKADPYHVRVSNMRKVLRVLDDYAALTTPHFVIRADSQLDGVLTKYMAEELEQVYGEITREYGFEPPQRTQIEVYNKAKGLAGHQWFSARMIGLPWLQTVGASTGLIIAMTSPAATNEPFNWARVLRHEFVHIVTLQQTDFNIPHWFTEALATRAEGYPHPKEWDALLIRRVKSGNLKNLDNIHLGFQRAESREDWDFAYCQSVLYAEYFIERFGKDALPKLLNAYRHTRSTDIALREAYGAEKGDVEQGYRAFLDRRVATLTASPTDPVFDEEAADARYKADPKPLQTRADYAQVRLRKRDLKQAEELAAGVLDEDPKNVVAATVLAQVRLVQKREDDALQILQTALNPDRPDRRLWQLLGQLLLKKHEHAKALSHFERASAAFPGDVFWLRGFAEAAEALDRKDVLKSTLEEISRLDADSVDARLQRAKFALADRDFATAVQYAKRALQVDVLDVNIHLTLARGYVGLNDHAAALAEFETALQLKPGDQEIAAERDAVKAGG